MIQQQRIQLDSIFIKALLLGGFLLSLFLSSPVRAESAAQTIQSLQPIPISSGGATLLPIAVLTGLTTGVVSPVAQFTLVNHLFTNAINDGINKTPDARINYVSAKKLFEEEVLCGMGKVLQTALVVTLMPQTSRNRDYGGTQDEAVRRGKITEATVLAQAFARTPGCDASNSSDSGIDQNILLVLRSLN